MVIHSDKPSKMSSISSKQDARKFIIVKNHVRELGIQNDKPPSANLQPEDTCTNTQKSDQKKNKKSSKKRKLDDSNVNSEVNEIQSNNMTEDTVIDPYDLQELRKVYTKCKEVMMRIESKYGHLLDFRNEETKKRRRGSDGYVKECSCEANKKIIFDDDGNEIMLVGSSDNHICTKNVKCSHSSNIAVVYEDTNPLLELPEDLQQLGKLLTNTKLKLTSRNEIIYKMKYLRQESVNDVRFEKKLLIDKLKGNTEDVLEFKGSNLLELSGYPDWQS